MKRREGTTEFTLVREDLINGGDKALCVTVDWTLEVSEYGDGSIDEEFTTDAYLEDGTEITLTENEELLLKEELEKNGEI